MSRRNGSTNTSEHRLNGYETAEFTVAQIPVTKLTPVINVAKSIKEKVSLKAVIITAIGGFVIFAVIPGIIIIALIMWIFR